MLGPGKTSADVIGAGATTAQSLYHEAMFSYAFVQANTVVTYVGLGSIKGKCRVMS